jgi:hypothetical protein
MEVRCRNELKKDADIRILRPLGGLSPPSPSIFVAAW